ncbi:hypothetical protein HYR99_27785 [Candidatus Poribacteria bacterium]|nr:hypothetical protein [Candidatus Poribacteria bacterium]
MKFLSAIILLFLTASLVGNAQNLPPIHPLDGSFIKAWLVIGPFSGEMETDFLAAVGGEANVNPKEGDAFNLTPQPPSHPHPNPPRGGGGSGGKEEDSPLRLGEGSGERSKTLTWKRHVAKGNRVVWGGTISSGEELVAYAFCLLDAGAGGEAEIRLGTPNRFFWINGALVHRTFGFKSSEPDQGRFRVNLRAGSNRCLVKLDAGLWLPCETGCGFVVALGSNERSST